jgi:putative transposase
LSHARWECKYHSAFVPKYRKKVIYGSLRAAIGRILRELSQQKGVEVLEGHTMPKGQHGGLG